MPRAVTAGDVATFEDSDPKAIGYTCIYPAPSKGFRRCGNPVNRDDRETASLIREGILSSIRRGTRPDDEDLRELAELCCCVRNHRVQVVNKPIMGAIVQKWQVELLEQRQRRQPVARQPDSPRITLQTSPPRVTRAQPTGIREAASSSSSPAPRFESYETHITASMSHILAEPLTEQQRKSGTLYCCSRASDAGFYKHGCSVKRTVTKRIENLQRCSGRTNTVSLQYSVYAANVHRAERLVQHELQQHRRKEKRCLDYPNCVTEHREWFEIDLTVLQRVMNRWAQWMNSADPYDENGRLREPWKQFCTGLEERGIPITSTELYLAWLEGLVVNEEAVDDSATDSSSDEEESPVESVGHQGCPICLEAISEPARTTCGHDFCSECIARVLGMSNRCPMCRTELVVGELPQARVAEILMQNAVGTS